MNIMYERLLEASNGVNHSAFTFVENLVNDAESFTFKELKHAVESVSNRILKTGIKEREAIAISGTHSIEFIINFLACLKLNIVPAVLPYETTKGDNLVRITEAVTSLNTQWMIIEKGLFEKYSEKLPQLNCLCMATHELSVAKEALKKNIRHKDEIAYFQFSSGTTGRPKVTQISWEALFNQLVSFGNHIQIKQQHVFVGWIPFNHDMGLILQLFIPLFYAKHSVNIPPAKWVKNPAILLKAVSHFSGTFSAMPSFAFRFCARVVKTRSLAGVDLSSWHTVICSSERINIQDLHAFQSRFSPLGLSGKSIVSAYGLAENVLAATVSEPTYHLKVHHLNLEHLIKHQRLMFEECSSYKTYDVVSCGVPIPDTKIKITDGKGQSLGDMELGEICVASGSLFSGYLYNKKETTSCLEGQWLRTGDLGYTFEGELFVVDRIKDLIILNGVNYSPLVFEDMSAKYLKDSFVKAAAFNSLTDANVAQVLIEKRKTREADDGLLTSLNEYLINETNVSSLKVEFVPRGWIELTTSGKPSRVATRNKYYLEKTNENKSSSTYSVIETLSGVNELDPKISLFDQGLDSLGFMKLCVEIEIQGDFDLDIAEFALNPTLDYLQTRRLIDSSAENNGAILETKRYHFCSTQFYLHLVRDRGPVWKNRALMPYGAGKYILNAISKVKGITKDIEFREFLNMLQFSDDPKELEVAERKYWLLNRWNKWRLHFLNNSSLNNNYVSFNNLDLLKHLRESGKGIVLSAYHSQLQSILYELLPKVLDSPPFTVIGHMSEERLYRTTGMTMQAVSRVEQKRKRNLLTRSVLLVNAHKVLKQNGIVLILTDDFEGEGGIQVDFLGASRLFRHGAANLARATSSAVVNVEFNFSSHGVAEIGFTLISDAPIDTETEITCAIASQFKSSWQKSPYTISPYMVKRHLQHKLTR